MKVIISRKGFDAESGGGPSPILPDGRLISLPIPEYAYSRLPKLRYKDLYYGKHERVVSLMDSLGYRGYYEKKSHLDPDLSRDALKERKDGWRPVFGQGEGQATHLENKGVGKGDMFLFFGWFRRTKYGVNGTVLFDPSGRIGKHVLFGYLQVGEVIKCDKNSKIPDWLEYHSHAAFRTDPRYKNNIIYVSNLKLSFGKDLAGAGTFRYNEKSAKHIVLTKDEELKSHWKLPSFLKDLKISHHSSKSWKKDYFQSTARGQEFVVCSDGNKKVEKWVEDIIKTSV